MKTILVSLNTLSTVFYFGSHLHESFENYVDDLDDLKASVDKAFKFCSRIRGKKSEALSLNEEIQGKLNDLLSQDHASDVHNSKRSRDDAADESDHPNKKRGPYKPKSSLLTSEDRVRPCLLV